MLAGLGHLPRGAARLRGRAPRGTPRRWLPPGSPPRTPAPPARSSPPPACTGSTAPAPSARRPASPRREEPGLRTCAPRPARRCTRRPWSPSRRRTRSPGRAGTAPRPRCSPARRRCPSRTCPRRCRASAASGPRRPSGRGRAGSKLLSACITARTRRAGCCTCAPRCAHPREVERGRDDRERRRGSLGRGAWRNDEPPRRRAFALDGRHVGVDDRAVLLAVRVDGARARRHGREQREQQNGQETHREGEPVRRL